MPSSLVWPSNIGFISLAEIRELFVGTMASGWCEHVRACREVSEHLFRVFKLKLHNKWDHHRFHEPGAVFRAAGRVIAPDFAPSETADLVFNLDNYRRPVIHDSKGDHNRCIYGCAIDEDLHPRDAVVHFVTM